MGYVKEYYERITSLSESDWEFIASCFEFKFFKKGSVITAFGQVEHYLSFVEDGVVRYFVPGEENDLTLHFAFGKEFISAYDSFLSRTPSEYALQALTDTSVWRIRYDKLQEVYRYTTDGNYIGRVIAERLFMAKNKRELSLLKFDARERYLRLMDEQPEVVRRIPLKYIASYIGVTPQALSRIRRQILNMG